MSNPRMNDMHQQHPDDHLSDDALRALAARLDASGAEFARERAGLADRVAGVFVRSRRWCSTPSVAGQCPRRRWWWSVPRRRS